MKIVTDNAILIKNFHVFCQGSLEQLTNYTVSEKHVTTYSTVSWTIELSDYNNFCQAYY